MSGKIPNQIGDYSLFALGSFILAFVFWPIGFVLGIIALSDLKKNKKLKGAPLAWIGIILPLIFITLMILFSLGMIGAFGFGIGSGMHRGFPMYW